MMKYKVTDIIYDVSPEDFIYEIDEEDFSSKEEYKAAVNRRIYEVIRFLPSELIVDIDDDNRDVGYVISNYISDKTGWLVLQCNYKRIF